ncbi:tRNA-dihydrouridine(16/17) synthase [NAD(P)(+)]-like protein [Nowakowskiella sp. JEL0407]|nr:tRNA-dihydrouridine(16/17) synthase [NAD(P)(+)]-like protein [Nowakowskiella sp. JEL0407]
MKGQKTGLADWQQIKRVKEALKIPVIANGNILYQEDIDRCIAETGVDGVMTAEGNLYNPSIFTGKFHPVWTLADEYLQIIRDYPKSATFGMAKAHLFKLFLPCLSLHTDLRTKLSEATNFDDLQNISNILRDRIVEATSQTEFAPSKIEVDERGYKILPYWVCQPHMRPEQLAEIWGTAGEEATNDDNRKRKVDSKSADANSENGDVIKEKVPKGRFYNPFCSITVDLIVVKKPKIPKHRICNLENCSNVGSPNCAFNLCKGCCKTNAASLESEKRNASENFSAELTSHSDKPSFELSDDTFFCIAHKSLRPGQTLRPFKSKKFTGTEESSA